jgi:hypothetical protein
MLSSDIANTFLAAGLHRIVCSRLAPDSLQQACTGQFAAGLHRTVSFRALSLWNLQLPGAGSKRRASKRASREQAESSEQRAASSEPSSEQLAESREQADSNRDQRAESRKQAESKQSSNAMLNF